MHPAGAVFLSVATTELGRKSVLAACTDSHSQENVCSGRNEEEADTGASTFAACRRFVLADGCQA